MWLSSAVSCPARGHPVTVTEEGGLLHPPHLPSGRLSLMVPGSQSLLCRADTKLHEGLRCSVYLAPGFPLLFKIKSDIVVCVPLLACFPQCRRGGEVRRDRKSRPGDGSAPPWWHLCRRGVSAGSCPCCSPKMCTGLCKMRSHGMCCFSSTNGAASLPSWGCFVRVRESSGPPWLLQPCPVL